MAYDGSRESTYAIKQFCNLFPSLCDLPTEILYIHEDAGNSIPDLENLQQFTRLKFESMSFSKLHFNAAEYFPAWINGKKNVLLVTGSFGRSALSYIGKRSFARDIIHDHQLPVFIAHP
jgi:UDP:flavonoid glycosyltransferase YjiC (YdhE family)